MLSISEKKVMFVFVQKCWLALQKKRNYQLKLCKKVNSWRKETLSNVVFGK